MRTLRVLAILIERQMTDDGPLLVGALGGAMVFLSVLGWLAFIYPAGFLLYVATILIVLPFLVGAGFFVLGVVQVCGDERRGLPGVLLALSATSGQIVLARLATGTVFVVVVAGGLGLAIAGAVISGLVQWPPSLVPEGLTDLTAALTLIGLASYGLGLLAARRTPGLLVPLLALLWGLMAASLVIIKGLGGPLIGILALLIVFLLVSLLASARHAGCRTIVLGFVALMVTAVPLYWLRFASDVVTARAMLEASDCASATAYRSLWRAQDSYAGTVLTVDGRIESAASPIFSGDVHFLLRPLGILTYLRGKESDGRAVWLRHFGFPWGLYYDKARGLLANQGKGTLYIGPDGMADHPTEALGRFSSPIVYHTRPHNPVVFDRRTRCFYTLNLEERDVYPGLRLVDAAVEPVDSVRSRVGDGICSVDCTCLPSRDKRDAPYAHDESGNYLPIVDESGAVAVIDLRTWTLLPNAGHLPRPYTSFGRGSSRPRDLFDYSLGVIVRRTDNEYAGLMAASVARQGSQITVAVFDKEGRRLAGSYRGGGFRLGALLGTKYLAESLHPPILTLVSFFAAYSLDAGATHRTLFLMPNSFVALLRDGETSFKLQLLGVLIFLLPALAFYAFLCWRVVRDAAVLGLSRWAKCLWGVGTAGFGLPVYITCRLTRPRVALSLCQNCGRRRRVDMEICHHCGSGWDMPVLEPPAWRVTSASVRSSVASR